MHKSTENKNRNIHETTTQLNKKNVTCVLETSPNPRMLLASHTHLLSLLESTTTLNVLVIAFLLFFTVLLHSNASPNKIISCWWLVSGFSIKGNIVYIHSCCLAFFQFNIIFKKVIRLVACSLWTCSLWTFPLWIYFTSPVSISCPQTLGFFPVCAS